MKPTILIEDGETGARWTFDLLHGRLEGSHRAACYRGRDEDGRPVFVKEVEAGDGDGRARAAREAAALRRLGPHPHVVGLLGTCVAGGGRTYRVFEWADVALHELLDRGHPTLRPLVAASVEEAIGSALRAVHDAGLVHCDVAPNNIVRVQGRWKLADFDIAVAAGEPTIGQPHFEWYLAPGRAVGEPARPEFDWDGLRAVVGQLRGSLGAGAPALVHPYRV